MELHLIKLLKRSTENNFESSMIFCYKKGSTTDSSQMLPSCPLSNRDAEYEHFDRRGGGNKKKIALVQYCISTRFTGFFIHGWAFSQQWIHIEEVTRLRLHTAMMTEWAFFLLLSLSRDTCILRVTSAVRQSFPQFEKGPVLKTAHWCLYCSSLGSGCTHRTTCDFH